MVLLLLLFACSNNVPVTHTVTFDLNGGKLPEGYGETITVNDGDTLEDLDDPTRASYSFAGWYTDEALTEPFVVKTPITDDITLYARWSLIETVKTYTVTFDLGIPLSDIFEAEYEKSATVEEGKTVAKPADPTLTYIATSTSLGFEGWYDDETCSTEFDFNTPITEDTTVYAKWNMVADGKYFVTNEDELSAWRDKVNTMVIGDDPDCILLSNIELTQPWESVGGISVAYDGTFEGNNHWIRNLDMPLFHRVDTEGVVQNVNLDVGITARPTATFGALVNENDGNIINCSTAGTVTIKDETSAIEAGGIAGKNDGKIIACRSSVVFDVSSSSSRVLSVGGIAETSDGSIIASYFTGSITAVSTGGNSFTSGIARTLTGNVIASYSAADITATASGTAQAYGIGSATRGTPKASYWSGNLSPLNTATGNNEVDGTTTWETAMAAMNTAIEDWNGSNANACPYTFTTGSDEKEPLVLTSNPQA